MIAQLEGVVSGKFETSLVVNVQGVGYQVFVANPLLERVREKDQITLFTHLAVHDDRFELFGFERQNELRFFKQLLKVRDVGPKSALSILSIGNLAQVQNAIMQEDADVLMSIPGIGKKTSERIILELKEKVFADGENAGVQGKSHADIIIGALTNLGYSSREAKEATRHMPKDLATDDERLKWVLKQLGNQR